MSAFFLGDVIVVEESLSQVHEERMETMDPSETRVETCDMVTSDLSPETDPVDTVSAGDKTLAPPPPQDSASTPEPVSSQESKVLSNEIQPETSDVIAPEGTASKTRQNHLPEPKPSLSRVSRTTQQEPAEAASGSAETVGAPVKAVEPFQLEPEKQNSDICNDKTEGCSSVQLKKMEDDVSAKRTCLEDEKKEETQQKHRCLKEKRSSSYFFIKSCLKVKIYLKNAD